MASLPSELLSHVIELAYPAQDERTVDYDGERLRKAGLLDAMLVCRQWNGVARPVFDSFEVFGTAREVDLWIQRAEAGEIDAKAVRDLTIRPVFDADAARDRIQEIAEIATDQAQQFMSLAFGEVGVKEFQKTYDDITDAMDGLHRPEEATFLAAWSTALRRLLDVLNSLDTLRFTELEIFLDSAAVSVCSTVVVQTLEWESALDDPDRDNVELGSLWERVWHFLDAQSRLTRLSIRQNGALPSGSPLRWSGDDMAAIDAGIASRLRHLSIAGELGNCAFRSTVLAVHLPALVSLVLEDVALWPDSTVFGTVIAQRSVPRIRISPCDLGESTSSDASFKQMISYFLQHTDHLAVNLAPIFECLSEDAVAQFFSTLATTFAGPARSVRSSHTSRRNELTMYCTADESRFARIAFAPDASPSVVFH